MKLKGYQCDRCLAYYEKNETMDDGRAVTGVAIARLDGTIRRFDLCDCCLNYVLAFLENPGATIMVDLKEEEEEELLRRIREDLTMTVREEN